MSEIGLIKSCCRKTEIYTFGTIGQNGYYYYECDWIKNTKHSRLVHILIAEVFLNNYNRLTDGLVVDHIDTNKLNNSVLNLRVVSISENLNNLKTREKSSLPIKCLNKGITVYFRGLSECARILKLNSPGSIYDWVSGNHPCTLYSDLTDFQYVSKQELENGDIKFIESFEELNLPNIPRRITSREEMIKFINDNKLTCKKDFISNGMENFYNSFIRRFPPIVYYKKEKTERLD